MTVSSENSGASQPSVFLTAEWRSLIMSNYAVPPELLTPYLPRGVELDLWQGEALISLVGFMFLNTRVLGVPIPWHRNFEEVNLRFYVRRHTANGIVRGVVFIRELVPRLAIATVARTIYNEPYLAVPMAHDGPPQGSGGRFEYSWRYRGQRQTLGAETVGEQAPMAAGSAEEFIFEHYWGYTRQRDGGTVEYQVEHPRWRVWQTARVWREGDAAALYGEAFAQALDAEPRSAFVAEGSPVIVRRGVRLPV